MPSDKKRLKFWSKVIRTKTCWIWQGGHFSNGYGNFRGLRAHRASWTLAYGSIPKGKIICHKCDVRDCVRPSHLFIGTQQDNIDDMFMKGRANKAKGSKSGRAKITEAIAAAIKASVGLHHDIANKYGISRPTVTLIKNGKRWAHLIK